MYVYTEDGALVNVAAAWGVSAEEDEGDWAVVAQFNEEFYLMVASAENEEAAAAILLRIHTAIKEGKTYLDLST